VQLQLHLHLHLPLPLPLRLGGAHFMQPLQKQCTEFSVSAGRALRCAL
jgi:hypothetical protein